MTVTQAQIDKMKTKGLNYTDIIARVANENKIHLYIMVAMLVKETGTVRNVYGHDSGGALSGFSKPVNQGNFEVFEWLVFTKGQTSNGVGPSQLTFKGFFTQMKEQGKKPWDPYDNITVGAKLIYSYYRTARNAGKSVSDSLKEAGTKYNGSPAYGDRYLALALEWKDLLGNSDYK